MIIRVKQCTMGPGWYATTKLKNGEVQVTEPTVSRAVARLALELAKKGI